MDPKALPEGVDPAIVKAKMEAGLSFEQAVEVCLTQIENDKAQAKSEKKSKSEK